MTTHPSASNGSWESPRESVSELFKVLLAFKIEAFVIPKGVPVQARWNHGLHILVAHGSNQGNPIRGPPDLAKKIGEGERLVATVEDDRRPLNVVGGRH